MAISERQVQISIESLSLVGFSRREAARFETAFRQELTSLVTESHGFAGGDRDQVSGNVAVGDAETMGRNVAHTVFGGLQNG